MNSPAVLSDIALTKQLSDGTIEWVPLKGVAQQEPASDGVSYTLIDRSRSYEAPQSLRLERRGDDLIVGSEGKELLIISDFFASQGTTFYPQPDIASGAGPFSGPTITPDTESVRESSDGPLIVWAGDGGSDEGAATEAASTVKEGGVSPWVWVGGGLALLGIAGAAGGGGGGGDDTPAVTPTPPTPPTPSDTTPPQITSSETAGTIDENSSAGQVVYTAAATDDAAVTWSLSGTDAAFFSIDSGSGVVTLIENPDFETRPSYEFTVVATDAAGNQSEQQVALAVNDLNDAAPRITSGASAATVDENSGSSQAVYTATADGSVTWSLGSGSDAAQLSINADSGVVTLLTNPDHEMQSSFSFSVVATDADGNRSEQPVNLVIADLDEVAPTITSGSATQAINENTGAGQLVYTATSTDTGDISSDPISYSLAQVGDAAAFSIDTVTGVVTLLENPNFETQPRYDFTVIATDGAGNSTQQSVSLVVNDLDDAAPRITSGAIANAIDENSGANQTIYTAAAEAGVTWSLDAGANSGVLSIDASTGAVTLATDPDHETQADYSFTVIATDAAGNSSQQAVSLTITDLDEVAPSITSSATAVAIDENSGAGQVVYIATSTDTGDISNGPTQYSLAPGADSAAFSIAATSGEVTLIGNPDFETQSSYSFTVIATDAAGNSTQQAVSLVVNDVDENAPQITSGATAAPVDENSGVDQAIYNATAGEAVTWSLAPGGDAGSISIDASTGEVTLDIDPDHETQPSYAFTVVATNAAGNSSQQTVSVAINDLDEVAPTITSAPTAAAINENTGAGQVVYTAESTDTGDISNGPTQYSLAPGADAAAFSIAATSGAVTLIGNPDFETQSSYSFTVVATDAAGNSTQQSVSLIVNDLDENAPPITSGATGTPIDENSGVDQVIYNATAGEAVTWSLAPGGDASAISIDASTGEVTLDVDPDHETQPSYAFTVVATNAAGNSSQQTVSVAINDLDEVAPTITSAATALAIDENTGANQIVYRATSTDTGDISTGNTTYSLAPGSDSAAFTINANTGVVRLIADPDFEAQPSYAFTVVATDAAGNSSQQVVSLDINDVNETQPAIVSVVLTDALGAQNDVLNAGDTVRVTVTLDTPVTVTGGTPQINLTIGGASVVADFVTGGSSDELLFEYVIQAGDNDDDGISVPANAIVAGGASITDALGNVADLDHAAVADDSAFIVDTIAPTLASSSPADDAIGVLIADDIVLTFAENVTANSGDITISDGTDTRVIDVTDATQVTVNGAVVTINPVDDLNPNTTYNVQVDADAFVDPAGNGYAGISTATELNFDTEIVADPTVVVFDLIAGESSSHSGRQFDAATSYDIYVIVDSDSSALAALSVAQRWSGADNLGTDDRIILVGDGADVEGPGGPAGVVNGVVVDDQFAAWETAGGTAAIFEGRSFDRTTAAGNDSVRLFANFPDGEFFSNQNANLNTRYLTDLPVGILTSQGLV